MLRKLDLASAELARVDEEANRSTRLTRVFLDGDVSTLDVQST